ncbi:ubiquinone biosynthesis protein COQ9, mitochondrial-like isoform X3 [Euwallacea fornicatus]|uniref:ubiquinone biosynthesis protein COQ9, mitochondrial-like isoform X3 n=1 Tax=Euwallacea fornicatus TaxID=995702 RepID=UPI00338F28C7
MSFFSTLHLPALRIASRRTYCIGVTQAQYFSSTPSKQNNTEYEEDIKNKILAASLPYVLELGWSKDCLVKGAEKLQNEFSQKPVAPGKFVELAIQERLKLLIPYIHKWPQAIAIMSLPPNMPYALAALLTMIDDICYYAGDRSVDFNWYMRRLGVAGVYKATELYLIQDKSEGNQQTWNFLRRRMEEAVQLHGIISKSDIAGQGVKDLAKSTFVTARNMLGMSWNK